METCTVCGTTANGCLHLDHGGAVCSHFCYETYYEWEQQMDKKFSLKEIYEQRLSAKEGLTDG